MGILTDGWEAYYELQEEIVRIAQQGLQRKGEDNLRQCLDDIIRTCKGKLLEDIELKTI
jgi:ketosteroid isomerase-like protein